MIVQGEKQVIKLVQNIQMYVMILNNGLVVSLSLPLHHTSLSKCYMTGIITVPVI